MRPDWTTLDETIKVGAGWLLGTRQPSGAMLTHHGLGSHVGGGLSVSFAPSGYLGDKRQFQPARSRTRKRGRAVVIFELGDQYDEETLELTLKRESFSGAEIAEFRSKLTEAGLPIADAWNGEGLKTGSFLTERVVMPSLGNAVSTYLDGCPEKGHSVFCGPGAAREEHRGCRWWPDHRDRLVEPVWPIAPPDTPPRSETQHEDDDRNLDAVRRALESIRPVLADLGVHPKTIVAGRRGVIEGEDELRFIESVGHGITIPAEVALRLVQLAELADRAGLNESEE